MPSNTLERLAAELRAVAEQMQREPIRRLAPNLIIDQVTRVGETAAPLLVRSEMLARWCELATRIYRFRRRRDRLFGAIFGEPAWDILLDLFVMEAKGKRVPVSSACIASGASHATALRQIEELVQHKLVLRERDESDKRRTYVRLSDEGTRKMALALEQLSNQPELRMADAIGRPSLLAG